MEKFKHYSFDLWLTLIKSNPVFKETRDRMFYDLFNPFNKSFEEVRSIIKEIDVNTNKYCEISGQHVPSINMIYNILLRLGMTRNLELSYLKNIDACIQDLFLKNLPSLYDENTHHVLETLVSNGSTISIGSNTGFISGKTIRVVLKQLDILKLFNFEVFSDELEVSKPNNVFFYQIYSWSRNCNKQIQFKELSSILHVGDNPIADIKGAEEFGFKAFQINSNDKKIIDLL